MTAETWAAIGQVGAFLVAAAAFAYAMVSRKDSKRSATASETSAQAAERAVKQAERANELTMTEVEIAREQAEDARRAELEANRPYVTVTAEPSLTGLPLFDLVVRNIGRRPALKVLIKFDPPPVRARQTEGAELSNTKMFNQPVAMIAPGQEMRTFFDSAINRHDRDDLPKFHTISLTYEDSSGRPYTEQSLLDVNALEGIIFTSVKTVHDIGKSLAEIQKIFKNASVLRREGVVEVDASVEPRGEKLEREAQEEAERRKQYEEIVQRVLPNQDEQADQPDCRE